MEQDADKVIMLYRQSYYEPVQGDDIVEIMVKKHRDGRLGNVMAKFEKECSRMTAMTHTEVFASMPDVPL